MKLIDEYFADLIPIWLIISIDFEKMPPNHQCDPEPFGAVNIEQTPGLVLSCLVQRTSSPVAWRRIVSAISMQLNDRQCNQCRTAKGQERRPASLTATNGPQNIWHLWEPSARQGMACVE